MHRARDSDFKFQVAGRMPPARRPTSTGSSSPFVTAPSPVRKVNGHLHRMFCCRSLSLFARFQVGPISSSRGRGGQQFYTLRSTIFMAQVTIRENKRFVSYGFPGRHCARSSLRCSGTRRIVIYFAIQRLALGRRQTVTITFSQVSGLLRVGRGF